MSTTRAAIEGSLWGLLIGDALGVPYEFHSPLAIPPAEQIEFEPPPGFSRAHAGVPPGTWSDDGSQALCLLASLLYCGRLDPEDLMRRIVNWYEHGYMAANGRVFDIGIQTSVALMAFQSGTAAIECGPRSESDNGNGSLMRVLPLALWHKGSDEELIRDARTQSLITHGHPRAQLCCALYCMWARRILQRHDDPWESAVESVRDCTIETNELDVILQPGSGRGTGYVVDSLRSVRAVMDAGSYEAVVKAAIQLGNDTDTTAAIAGGIAGLRDGIDAIPVRWRNGLRDSELFMPMLAQVSD